MSPPTADLPSGTGQASDPTCSATTFSKAQQLVKSELSARVKRLDTLMDTVDTSNHLSQEDQSALRDDISTVELPGIEDLQGQVEEPATCVQVRNDAHAMVYDYRVFLLMTPQTHLTVTSDDETYVEGDLSTLVPDITQAIANAHVQGRNTDDAQSALADLEAQLTAASGETNGESSVLLQQIPQGYPGNWQVLLSARTNETNARNDLHAAYADLLQIKKDLR